jgi:hypothetical protein
MIPLFDLKSIHARDHARDGCDRHGSNRGRWGKLAQQQAFFGILCTKILGWLGWLAVRRFGTFSFLCLEFTIHTVNDEQSNPAPP